MMGGLELFFLLFLRISGFFLSPLSSLIEPSQKQWVGLALATALLLSPASYKGMKKFLSSSSALLALCSERGRSWIPSWLSFFVVDRSGSFCGQVIGTLSGFSATELFDPFFLLRSPNEPPLCLLVFTFFSLLIFTTTFSISFMKASLLFPSPPSILLHLHLPQESLKLPTNSSTKPFPMPSIPSFF